jgi:hypothetical protein
MGMLQNWTYTAHTDTELTTSDYTLNYNFDKFVKV